MSPEMMRLHAYCAALGDHRNGTFDAFIKAYGPGGRTLLAADLAALTAPARGDGAEWLEQAALICEQKAEEFLSPEYATQQPLSSLSERFACAECARTIRAAAPAAPAGDGNSERDALEAEVARLRGENAALKKQIEGPTNTRFNDWLLASHTPPEHGEKG